MVVRSFPESRKVPSARDLDHPSATGEIKPFEFKVRRVVESIVTVTASCSKAAVARLERGEWDAVHDLVQVDWEEL